MNMNNTVFATVEYYYCQKKGNGECYTFGAVLPMHRLIFLAGTASIDYFVRPYVRLSKHCLGITQGNQ